MCPTHEQCDSTPFTIRIAYFIQHRQHDPQCMQEAQHMHGNPQHKQRCYNLCWSNSLRVHSQLCSFYMLAALPHPQSLPILQGYQTHEVVQLHYLAWPDYGVPYEVFPIFNFIDRMKMLRAPEHGPTVVHCRWGFGSDLAQQSFLPASFFFHLHCFIFSAIKIHLYGILYYMGIF